jgi:hypothetical protein
VEPVALRPLRVGETIDVALKLYRSHFSTLVRIVLIVSAPAQILLGLIQASIRTNVDTTSGTGFTSGFDPATGTYEEVDGKKLAATMIGFFALLLITLLTSELASGATFRAVGAAYLGEEQDWKTSVRYALKRLKSIVWVTIAKNFIIFCGFIACIVPGVYFYAAYGVATPALMLEGVKGRKALRRSKDLVKGRWRPVAGVLLLGSLLTQIISGGIGALASGVLFTNNEIASDVARVIAGIIGAALTVPILAAIITVLYIDLRVRKEGLDLELLAETVGVDPSGLPAPAFLTETGSRPGAGDDQPPFWPPPPGWKPRSQA